MFAMIASQIALTACLGCVPLDRSPDLHTQPWLDGSRHLELTFTPEPENQASPVQLTPQLSSTSALGAANWSTNDAVLALKLDAVNTPLPLLFQHTEVYTAEVTFTAAGEDTGFGLDLAVAPRATIENHAGFKSARAGAEVRIGQNLEQAVASLDQRGVRPRVNSWYIFASSDDEALCWDLGDHGATFDGVALRDQVTVGDIQAGIAFHRAGGELSIGYVHREFSSRGVTTENSISMTEDFTAVSFTMRR